MSWGFAPEALAKFRQATGCEDPYDYFDVDVVHLSPRVEVDREKIRSYFDDARWKEGTVITDFGVVMEPGGNPNFVHWVPPLPEGTLEDYKNFPFPRYDKPEHFDLMEEGIRSAHARGRAVSLCLAITLFEISWPIMGMEQFLAAMYTQPESVCYILDRMLEMRCYQARICSAMDPDVIFLGDDISMQTGMIMSPQIWRQFFKPRMRKITETIRSVNPAVPIAYHTDGNPEAVVDDFIEIGINVLNPVQPEAIDPAMAKERWGDRLAFWGGISIQHILPFGTPEAVRQEVKLRMETIGRGGGYLIGPSHMIEPEVPWENLVALHEAIDEFGYYG